MAFKLHYQITIVLRAGLSDINAKYEDVLSQSDLAQLEGASTQVFYADDAYHRIEQMQVSKESIDFTLAIYNKDVTKLITTKQYSFIPDTSERSLNYHTQCYEYVKSLNENIGAIDC